MSNFNLPSDFRQRDFETYFAPVEDDAIPDELFELWSDRSELFAKEDAQ